MVTALYSHADSRRHTTPAGHPERVARIEALEAALAAPEFGALQRREAPLAADEDLFRCHPEGYVAGLRRNVPRSGEVALDPDTYLTPGAFDAASRAVGGACAAVDLVLAGGARNAFVACRPPGHHAERERPMGFCLLGTVAIAAKRALDHHGLGRVAVLDFDVHHGNGTQDLLWEEERTLFASTHQMPLFPGTGARGETGAAQNVMNRPLRPGTGGAEMRAAWSEILDAVRAFEPELILVSAGFDAHAADPLASLNWREEDFVWVTREICALADEVCAGRVVSSLEGGYDLDALAASAAGHVAVLMEQDG